MKKLIIFLSFIALFSCDKAEDYEYLITLQSSCPNGVNQNQRVRIGYCVSKSTFETVSSSTGDRCISIEFQDIDGIIRSGYYVGRSFGEGVCN